MLAEGRLKRVMDLAKVPFLQAKDLYLIL